MRPEVALSKPSLKQDVLQRFAPSYGDASDEEFLRLSTTKAGIVIGSTSEISNDLGDDAALGNADYMGLVGRE